MLLDFFPAKAISSFAVPSSKLTFQWRHWRLSLRHSLCITRRFPDWDIWDEKFILRTKYTIRPAISNGPNTSRLTYDRKMKAFLGTKNSSVLDILFLADARKLNLWAIL